MFKNTDKIILKKIWLCLFTFRPITLKQLNSNNRYSQLTQRSRVNASDWGARGPGFDCQLWQGFLCYFLFCCCCVLTFLSKILLVFVTKFCNSFCDVSSFNKLKQSSYQYLTHTIEVNEYYAKDALNYSGTGANLNN